MSAFTFSHQNDAGSGVSDTQYWENLVLIVILVLESKGLKLLYLPYMYIICIIVLQSYLLDDLLWHVSQALNYLGNP